MLDEKNLFRDFSWACRRNLLHEPSVRADNTARNEIGKSKRVLPADLDVEIWPAVGRMQGPKAPLAGGFKKLAQGRNGWRPATAAQTILEPGDELTVVVQEAIQQCCARKWKNALQARYGT
jgi:hypothetical protein